MKFYACISPTSRYFIDQIISPRPHVLVILISFSPFPFQFLARLVSIMVFARFILWGVQRVASISLLVLLLLLYLALWRSRPSESSVHPDEEYITISQFILICYTTFVHFLGLLFPLRASWALWTLTKRLKGALYRQQASTKRYPNSYEESFSSSSESEASFELNERFYPEKLLHAIIIPNYKEDIDTLRETLEVLADHPQASAEYDVGNSR